MSEFAFAFAQSFLRFIPLGDIVEQPDFALFVLISRDAQPALAAIAPRNRDFARMRVPQRPGSFVILPALIGVVGIQQFKPLIAGGQFVSFTSSADAAIAAVEKREALATGDAQAAVLLRPTSVSDVEAVVSEGDRLPQKSTHFFPKMYSGLFGVSLEDGVY